MEEPFRNFGGVQLHVKKLRKNLFIQAIYFKNGPNSNYVA